MSEEKCKYSWLEVLFNNAGTVVPKGENRHARIRGRDVTRAQLSVMLGRCRADYMKEGVRSPWLSPVTKMQDKERGLNLSPAWHWRAAELPVAQEEASSRG